MYTQLSFFLAIAAVLAGIMFSLSDRMEARMGSQMVQMEARMGSQMVQMEARMGSQMVQMEARMDGLWSSIARLTDSVVQTEARMDGLWVQAMSSIARLTDSVEGLLASTLTPAAAQATLACAKASVYSLFLWHNNSTSTEQHFRLCSAFAYMELKGGATVAVSASHCFDNLIGTTFDATRHALPRDARVKCRLLKVFVSDSAVLRCEDAPPPLVRTSAPPVFAQAVVAAGFFNDTTGYPAALSVHNNYAMHVVSSNIVVSMGPMAAARNTAGGGASLHAVAPPLAPFGMLQGMLLQGMSGGPVMDVRCGVVGIISHATTNTAFSVLDEVDAWLLREQWE